MKRTLAAFTLCLFCGCASGLEPLPSGLAQIERTDPQRVLRSGEWELHLWYTAEGTRSEGQYGVLFQDGVRVQADIIGKELETSLGRMKYYELDAGQMPWGPKGWNFAEHSKILPSWAEEESR